MKRTTSFCRKWASQAALTLVELMVSLGLGSIVILAAFTVFSGGINLASVFNRSLGATELILEGVDLLSSIFPLVTRIRSCNCTGTGSSTTDCQYEPNTDPFVDGGNSAGATLFDGDFESHHLSWVAGSGIANAATSYITTNGLTGKYACETNPFATTSRGCKWRFKLIGYPSVKESGSTPSTPGELRIRLSSTAAPNSYTEHRLGRSTLDKAGITYVYCGFKTPTSGQVSNLFVLDIDVKIKNSVTEDPSNNLYEGFHYQSKNYTRGFFRKQHLQYQLVNIGTRGVYSWRVRRLASCSQNGANVQDSLQCCTQCMTAAGVCQSCIRSGQAATEATRCASQQLNSGGNACL